jgi:prepilin-type N-terminal cleavage/methylation domain-containing protein
MKTNVEQSKKQKAFTIIELLTVMSIIVILFGLLVPAMNLVRRYAKDVKQAAQFHAIDAGLQMFHDDFQGYPDSTDRSAGTWLNYPGGMRLTEAMVGQDLLGFHPSSTFDKDDVAKRYPRPFNPGDPCDVENLRSRKGPYVTVEKANIVTIGDYYNGVSPTPTLGHASYAERRLIIADEYSRVKSFSSGKRIGMPVLYYKANVSGYEHRSSYVRTTDSIKNIYNSEDNQELINQPLPWDTETVNPKINPTETGASAFKRPYNSDTYILMSAGADGLYGTRDDMFNFEKE